jgi:hypothetical protein
MALGEREHDSGERRRDGSAPASRSGLQLGARFVTGFSQVRSG